MLRLRTTYHITYHTQTQTQTHYHYRYVTPDLHCHKNMNNSTSSIINYIHSTPITAH